MIIILRTNVLGGLAGSERSIFLEREDLTLLDVLLELSRKYCKEAGDRLLEQGDLRKDLIVLLNNEAVTSQLQLNRKVCEGDVLTILQAIAGG